VFAYHNYLKDPPFAKIDLISCRNSLIYLESFLQKNALTTFHYSLNEKGFLLLGKSETAGPASELYAAFDKNDKIYTRKGLRGKFLHVIANRKEEIFRGPGNGLGKKESIKDDFQKAADDVLLSKYAPPGVIVNNEMDIVQFRGATGIWLEPSPGKPNLNVLKMAREGLSFELRNAIHKVQKTKLPFIKEDIPMQFMEKERLVTIEVIPLLHSIEPHFLILFRDTSFDEQYGKKTKGSPEAVSPESKEGKELLRIENLQKELAQAREDMRAITEDQEATNEELQSANEELLSGSEELQSLNEELETSKEEIQNSNEELLIFNQELYDRNDQLNHSRQFAESIVTTIREPIVVLNKNLQVRSANKSFYTKFQTTEEETVGKVFFELGNKQWDVPALRKLLEKMLPEKSSIVDFEVAQKFPGLGERIMLLNASRIIRDTAEEQTILLAIEDITEKRKIEKELKLFSEELENQVRERTAALQKANNDLRNSNSDLEQFAYIASHDLQEPLRKIKTFCSILIDKHSNELSAGSNELIAKIINSAGRMSALVHDVLNFSKINHEVTTFEKTDLNTVISKIKNDYDLLIAEKGAIIFCEQLPVIEANSSQLYVLFGNLLGNAVKFSKKETAPIVTITSKMLTPQELKKHTTLDKKLTYCQINIKDNGIGFDQEFSEQIFLIFSRLHNAEKFPGTGIGLAACKKIVLNHGGKILVTAKEDEGALFQIILPVKH
jgi:two-component system CheB/CheR fusion protein